MLGASSAEILASATSSAFPAVQRRGSSIGCNPALRLKETIGRGERWEVGSRFEDLFINAPYALEKAFLGSLCPYKIYRSKLMFDPSKSC
jgi:hypothetical protein